MARLGLGFEDLHAVNPRLIYVSLTGYGQTGPYAQLAGHDLNYMALGGALALNLPVIPGVQIADLVGGSMQAVTGILLALVDRNVPARAVTWMFPCKPASHRCSPFRLRCWHRIRARSRPRVAFD